MGVLDKKYNAREIAEAFDMRLDLVYSKANNAGLSAAGGLTAPEIKKMFQTADRSRRTMEVNPENVEELRVLERVFGLRKQTKQIKFEELM